MVALGALTLGLVVGIPSALGSGWQLPLAGAGTVAAAEPTLLTSVPADQPAKGLVHGGLAPGRKGTPCAGQYEIVGTDRCSHGPDEAPAGLSVKTRVAPVAAARPEPVVPQSTTPLRRADELGVAAPTAAPAAATNSVVCDGDGTTGKRVQVLYVRDADTASQFAKYEASFRTWAAGVDTIYDASAQDTGGRRHLRYVTTADCQVDVREVEVPAGQMADFSKTMSALKKLGYNRTDRKYMIFGDATVYCGIGTFAGDDQAGAKNRSNAGPSYGRNDSGCWAAGVAAHELGHNLGAVSDSAPNSSKAGHCVDEYDVMCYKDADGTVLRIVCTSRSQFDNKLDCNHDDYYSTNPEPGSYLASHWNVANNEFLIAGETGGATPTPTPTTTGSAPTASPSPTVSGGSPTAGPSPTTSATPTATTTTPPGPTSPAPSSTAPVPDPTGTPTGTATPTATGSVAKLTAADVTATSARLSWPAAARTSRYAVVVDGRTAATVRATSASLTGLAPGTTYQVKIVVRGADHTDVLAVTTPAAVAPAASTWFTLTNALTGDAADLYGSRSALRTPLVSFAGNGGASQAWQLAGGKLVSKATGRCAGPLRPAAGSPLVQQECATAATFQLVPTAAGLSLTSGGLVVGLAQTTYAGRPLLALQAPTGGRLQAWSAQPL
jgi:fibronectin type III domain protein